MYRPGTAGVPVWLPWPLPLGWLVAGFAGVGDERTGVRACAVALAGPNPLGGPADMVVVAEEPGIGLGAALAGLDSVDPGAGFGSAPPIATAARSRGERNSEGRTTIVRMIPAKANSAKKVG